MGLCLLSLRQENFEVFLAFEDYSNHSLVAELREQYIKAQEVAQAKHKPRGTAEPAAAKKSLSTESKLHRQALALQVSEQELEAELTLRALSDGKVGTALKKCRCVRLRTPQLLGGSICFVYFYGGQGGPVILPFSTTVILGFSPCEPILGFWARRW